MTEDVKKPKSKHTSHTAFKEGNTAAAGVDHSGRKRMTQMLIAALNEPFYELDRKTGKKKTTQSGLSRMAKVIDNLIDNATYESDQKAIDSIYDRVDGKVPQAITGDDGGPLEVIIKGGLPT